MGFGGAREGRPTPGASTAAWWEGALLSAPSRVLAHLPLTLIAPGGFSCSLFLISQLFPRRGLCLCAPTPATPRAVTGVRARRGSGAGGTFPGGSAPAAGGLANMAAWRGRCWGPGSVPASTGARPPMESRGLIRSGCCSPRGTGLQDLTQLALKPHPRWLLGGRGPAGERDGAGGTDW